ncbi:cytochrome P450 2K4-like [Anneissia japonica]|uniref:cytochrome P450 2K4-like n=1 Tax=Anneissia japonica TaxID=1529436 RepID=UPI001425820E|nr:cytochrome P450 2K4-like [Anneissia japonica]
MAEKGSSIPGPRPSRIIGNLKQICPKAHITWTEWCQRYGPVCRVNLGPMGDSILLGNIDVLRRAFEESPEIFSGRFVLPIVKKDGAVGTMTWENDAVYDQRRQLLSTVMKQVDLDKLAQNEAIAVCDVLSEKGDTSSDLVYRLIEEANLSMISTFCFRREQRCPYDDPKFKELKNRVTKMNHKLKNLMGEKANLFPVLWAPFYKDFRKKRKNLRCLVSKELDAHKENLDSSNIRDLIDGYLGKADGIEFPENDCPWHIMNLMGSTITLKNAIQWIILLITKHPEIQTKVQEEVSSVFVDRAPTTDDVDKLPYTNATIYETLRIACPAAQVVPHMTQKDVNFDGFDVKSGTVVFGNIWGLHHDKNHWEEPEKFNPDRFLDSNGQLDIDKESFVPFGLGKRRCPGETYAKKAMFMFVTNIYQRYGFEAVDGETLPDVDEGVINVGLHNPPPYKLKIVPRN